MFESAEVEHKVDRKAYKKAEIELREALLEAQYELRQQARFQVLILISGVEGAGKGETVKLLNEWMDPRYIEVSTFNEFSDSVLARPTAWRYWQRIPQKGRIGIFFMNWYNRMIRRRLMGEIKGSGLDKSIEDAVRLERMLCDEGVLVFKFWFHLSKKQMQHRLKVMQDDPMNSWRLSPLEWHQLKVYDKIVNYGERVIRRSSRDNAPWYIIEGADANYRSLKVGNILLEGMQAALASKPRPEREPHTAPLLTEAINSALLDSLDLTQRLKKSEYKKQLGKEQERLLKLIRDKRMRKHSVIAVFEGNDAAGKGGTIRRVTGALDPREYHIIPIGVPTTEERSQPYLWRFWQHVPGRGGKLTIFDRSWYGRVLVERVDKLIAPADWLRAYDEINDFEEQLVSAGAIVVKFWLAIDKDTQLERFQARENTPFKRFKITEDDWHNRENWDAYVDAVGDMVDRTSTEVASWTLVEANDKRFARIKVLRTLNDTIEAALNKD